MLRRGARSVYRETLNWMFVRSPKLTLPSRDFYKSCVKPETDRHEDHVAGLICHVSHISPCISFYVLSHRDVDWALLSLVMRSDRCTWLASCYVTHIRFHWQKIHLEVIIFTMYRCGMWREKIFLVAKNFMFFRWKRIYVESQFLLLVVNMKVSRSLTIDWMPKIIMISTRSSKMKDIFLAY